MIVLLPLTDNLSSTTGFNTRVGTIISTSLPDWAMSLGLWSGLPED
jgi:hypothetical protein